MGGVENVTRVHVLSDPPIDQNTQAFLVPILGNRRLLRERGLEIKCYYSASPSIYECDVLAINNKFWPGSFECRRSEIIEKLGGFAEKIDTVLFFDRSSSAGHVIPEVFPFVSRYYKTSLLRDRSSYLLPIYGGRAFAEFYHREFGITDDFEWNYKPIVSESDLGKLDISWNTSLGNYAWYGPRLTSLYARFPLQKFLTLPRNYHSPSAERSVEVSCRMGFDYSHRTVAFQRREVADLLKNFRRTDRISKLAYFKELKNSKVVVSPFGYSEINYKDFETFLCGALLVKPDMSHLETYPDLYREGETFVSHSWVLTDLMETIEEILANDQRRIDIARNGQDLYRWHVSTDEGRTQFVERLLNLLSGNASLSQIKSEFVERPFNEY